MEHAVCDTGDMMGAGHIGAGDKGAGSYGNGSESAGGVEAGDDGVGDTGVAVTDVLEVVVAVARDGVEDKVTVGGWWVTLALEAKFR